MLATAYVPCFSWDEPDGCTTPRGWVHLENHPEGEDYEHTCVGNYLQYFDPTDPDRRWCSRGPNGETVHAVAYIFTRSLAGTSSYGLGWAWFHTIEEAKAFIVGNVMAYFGLPRGWTSVPA